MSRRVSQKRRANFSELVQTSNVPEQDVLCDQKIRLGSEPRKLVYRRLRGVENVFDGSWPETTNIHCWYCRQPFTTTPVPIVQQYDPVKDLYDVYGITCSPACSKAFISRNNNNDSRTRLMWQCKMLIEVFGWPRDKPIPTADDWEAIDVFGGYMTIDEWRKTKPGIKIRIKKPPFVPFHIFVETEYKGLSVIDQTTDECAIADQADTLEQQAVMHGAAFSLKNLKRPDEDKIIRTTAQLHAAHPRYKEEETTSFFDEFLRTQPLPSDEACMDIRNQREAERKAKRKRKKTPISMRTTAAAARGKTLFVQSADEADEADEADKVAVAAEGVGEQENADATPSEAPGKKKKAKRVTITLQTLPPAVAKRGRDDADADGDDDRAPKRQKTMHNEASGPAVAKRGRDDADADGDDDRAPKRQKTMHNEASGPAVAKRGRDDADADGDDDRAPKRQKTTHNEASDPAVAKRVDDQAPKTATDIAAPKKKPKKPTTTEEALAKSEKRDIPLPPPFVPLPPPFVPLPSPYVAPNVQTNRARTYAPKSKNTSRRRNNEHSLESPQ